MSSNERNGSDRPKGIGEPIPRREPTPHEEVDPEAYLGPWRAVASGDNPRQGDIRFLNGVPIVPTRIYGRSGQGLRTTIGEPIPTRETEPSVPITPRRPLSGVPVLGAVADFVGEVGRHMPWARRTEIADGKSHISAVRGPGRHKGQGNGKS